MVKDYLMGILVLPVATGVLLVLLLPLALITTLIGMLYRSLEALNLLLSAWISANHAESERIMNKLKQSRPEEEL